LIHRHRSQFIYKTQNWLFCSGRSSAGSNSILNMNFARVTSNNVANCTLDGCSFTKACARTFLTARMASHVTQETFRLQFHISISLLFQQPSCSDLLQFSPPEFQRLFTRERLVEWHIPLLYVLET
jgi:hypothetical protein